jgi:NAD(P)-dependent dehydrogenase (short-subunit alcohol dehydrogenase family)
MKTIVITGATSGIGLEVLKASLKKGFKVIGIGRAQKRIDDVMQELSEYVSKEQLVFFKADLMEPSEVNRVGLEIKNYLQKNSNGLLYSLVNNAGCVRNWYSTNSQGYEQQFALNHLAGFYLTHFLLDCIIKAKGKILFTSSKSHRNTKIHWKDIMFEKHYHPLLVYKQSKLANMLFAYELNNRYKAYGIKAYGIDPGLVNTNIGLKNTGGLVQFVWNIRKRFGISPEIPAKTYLYLLEEMPIPMDLYYHNSKSIGYSDQVNFKNSFRLFVLSEQLCNIKFGDHK